MQVAVCIMCEFVLCTIGRDFIWILHWWSSYWQECQGDTWAGEGYSDRETDRDTVSTTSSV